MPNGEHFDALGWRKGARQGRGHYCALLAIGAGAAQIVDVLDALGGWQAALGSADLTVKRERLGNLIEQLGPERTGHGGYRAKIPNAAKRRFHCQWSPRAAMG